MNKIIQQKEKIKPIWCPGCGLYSIFNTISIVMNDLGWHPKNTVVISGIGCSGRAAGYFTNHLGFDSVNTTHGRAIPVAEGIKINNPKLNVIVFSGDGDLLSIGGNHLLHTSRRNANLKIICNANEVYGMTGGQIGPLAKIGTITTTTPTGSNIEPINAQKIITSNKNYFFARTSISELQHLKESIKQSFLWQGFSFAEIHSLCLPNYAHKIGIKDVPEALKNIKERFSIQNTTNELRENELGVMSNNYNPIQ